VGTSLGRAKRAAVEIQRERAHLNLVSQLSKKRLPIKRTANRKPHSAFDVKMKRKMLLLCGLFLVVFVLEGCATLRGIGEDIQNLGRGLKRTISE
jgi:predicted small secreted protein